jgi:hypothetical protein
LAPARIAFCAYVDSNKAKKKQGNKNKKAFISFYFFFGIGTFQRVMADSNKKIPTRPDFTRYVEMHSSDRYCISAGADCP